LEEEFDPGKISSAHQDNYPSIIATRLLQTPFNRFVQRS